MVKKVDSIKGAISTSINGTQNAEATIHAKLKKSPNIEQQIAKQEQSEDIKDLKELVQNSFATSLGVLKQKNKAKSDARYATKKQVSADQARQRKDIRRAESSDRFAAQDQTTMRDKLLLRNGRDTTEQDTISEKKARAKNEQISTQKSINAAIAARRVRQRAEITAQQDDPLASKKLIKETAAVTENAVTRQDNAGNEGEDHKKELQYNLDSSRLDDSIVDIYDQIGVDNQKVKIESDLSSSVKESKQVDGDFRIPAHRPESDLKFEQSNAKPINLEPLKGQKEVLAKTKNRKLIARMIEDNPRISLSTYDAFEIASNDEPVRKKLNGLHQANHAITGYLSSTLKKVSEKIKPRLEKDLEKFKYADNFLNNLRETLKKGKEFAPFGDNGQQSEADKIVKMLNQVNTNISKFLYTANK